MSRAKQISSMLIIDESKFKKRFVFIVFLAVAYATLYIYVQSSKGELPWWPMVLLAVLEMFIFFRGRYKRSHAEHFLWLKPESFSLQLKEQLNYEFKYKDLESVDFDEGKLRLHQKEGLFIDIQMEAFVKDEMLNLEKVINVRL